MNSIRKKIILLSVVIWAMMLIVWMLMSYSNQKTIDQYNAILQRYMLMNQISQLSEAAVSSLNQYIANPETESKYRYLTSSDDLKMAGKRLEMLRNQNNDLILTNYIYMIESQLESMDLAATYKRDNSNAQAVYHFGEAAKVSKYIAETTLSLLSRELTTYDEFYKDIIKQSGDLKKMGFSMLAVTSFMALLLFYKFSNDITGPIMALTLSAREISRGNFDRSVEVRTNDEIHFLAATFDRMRVNIRNLIAEMHNKAQVERDLQEHKLLLKESELKSLQSQINPHFLFNTLNTLSKKAYLEGATETSSLIVSVSELLRYNLRSLDASVTLRNELKGLEEYLTIQKARFADRVQYTIDAAANCLDFTVPSLTLQPFVENAFIHSIEPSETGGRITITIREQTERIEIRIADDGPGMPGHIATSIIEGQTQSAYKGHSTGIGAGNVVRRLRLFYGVQDIIEIESVPGNGTCIIMLLPKQRSDRLG